MTIDSGLGSREVDAVAIWARRAIWAAATVLAALFAFLKLNQLPYISFFENTNPSYIREIILAVYYCCWVFGSSFDVSIQRFVYTNDPQHGLMKRDAWIILIGFISSAALLLWVRDNDRMLALLFVAFFALNIFGFRFIQKRVRPMIDASKKQYATHKAYAFLAQLKEVEHHMLGRWQWIRFAVLSVFVAALAAISLSDEVRRWVASIIHTVLPLLSTDAASQILPVGALALYVAVSEVWIWFARSTVAARVHAIGALNEQYELVPRL